MDVRLYPSAPAVGARPGAEPAGLAPLDYYHCGKVGGGGVGARRAGPARAFGPRAAPERPGLERAGSGHPAARDAGALGDTRGEMLAVWTRGHTHPPQPCRRARTPLAPIPLAVTLNARSCWDHRQKSPDSCSHEVTVTHSPRRP